MTTELTKGAMAKRRLPELLHSLSAWVGPSRADAGSERPPEDQTEGSLPLVKRPVDRSVLWLPGGWGEQGTGWPYPYELFVESEVLRDVEAHALEEIEGSYGLLTGRLLACNETRVPFVSVEASHSSDSPMPVGEDLTSFREFFWKVGETAGRRGRVLVGWYHTHSLLGLQLSERDRQVHVGHFQDEWPCALVVVTRHGASKGGFFQRDRGDILFRRSTRPFRELVSQQVEPGGGPYVTSVTWENYWTHEPVLYARKPGDLPSKGGRWSWRQRPRGGHRSGKTLADLVARISEEPAGDDSSADLSSADLSSADLSGADVHRPTAAETGAGERRESAEPTYERAMGRPAREDGITGSRPPIPAGPPPKEAWDEWKRALGVRREREGEIRKVEAEQAAVDAARADADAEARARATLAARAAAEAAARAAAEALGIGSESEAIAAEAVSKAEAGAEVLVAEEEAAKLASKKETPKKAAPAAKKEEAKAKEPVVEEPVDVLAGANESDEEEAAAESAEEAAAVVESEGPSEAELVVEEAELAEVEVPEPAAETGGEPEPEAEVEEEPFVLEVAASESAPEWVEETATPAEESRAGETPKELDKQAELVARSSLQPTGDGEMVVPLLVLPDSPPRAKLRRYVAWVGITLPLAAALAWILLG